MFNGIVCSPPTHPFLKISITILHKPFKNATLKLFGIVHVFNNALFKIEPTAICKVGNGMYPLHLDRAELALSLLCISTILSNDNAEEELRK